MTSTPSSAPVTIAGALRAYLMANLPEFDIYRNEAPQGATVPLAVIIDPIDTRTSTFGTELILSEQIQVDLYLPVNDTSSLADSLTMLLHKAPISIPGSTIHDVLIKERRMDTTDPGTDDGITRIIFTVEVTRRLTPGDTTTPLPFPVRPDRLSAHETATTNVHGIADTAELETKTGAQAKADAVEAAAKAYTDTAVADIQLPENIETTAGAQAKADAAEAAATTVAAGLAADGLTAAKSFAQRGDEQTLSSANNYTDAALTEAKAYTDSTVATIDLAPYETLTGAQAKADAAQAAATSYADITAQDVINYTDATYLPKSQKGAANGLATLGLDGKIPNSQFSPFPITETHTVNTEAAMLALDAQKGDVAVRTDLSRSFILVDGAANVLANWQELLTPPNAVLSVEGRVGAVSLNDLYDASGAAAAAQAAAVDTAKTYADTVSSAAKSEAQIYADAAAQSAQATATSHADTVAATAYANAVAHSETIVTAAENTAASQAAAAQSAAETHADTAIASHVSATDPHGDRAAATAALDAHLSATDPHGDRANAASLYTPLTDTRLTNTRTPTDGTVTTSKIVDGAVTPAKQSGHVYDWISNYPSMPILASGSYTPTGWVIYSRILQGGTITKAGFFMQAAQSVGTLHIGIYRNTGSGRNATPGTLVASVVTPASTAWNGTFQEFAFPSAVTVQPGDWLAVLFVGTVNVLAHYGNLFSSLGVAGRPGTLAFQGAGTATSLPATAAAQTATAPGTGGVPYFWGLA